MNEDARFKEFAIEMPSEIRDLLKKWTGDGYHRALMEWQKLSEDECPAY